MQNPCEAAAGEVPWCERDVAVVDQHGRVRRARFPTPRTTTHAAHPVHHTTGSTATRRCRAIEQSAHIPCGTISHAARYPRGTAPHAARYPCVTISHVSRYPTRHGTQSFELVARRTVDASAGGYAAGLALSASTSTTQRDQCTTLQRATTRSQRGTAPCSAVQHVAPWLSTMQHGAPCAAGLEDQMQDPVFYEEGTTAFTELFSEYQARISVLRYVAARCIMLQHVVSCCSVLCYVAS